MLPRAVHAGRVTCTVLRHHRAAGADAGSLDRRGRRRGRIAVGDGGNPRFVVLWNRELSDAVTSDYDAVDMHRATLDVDRRVGHAEATAENRSGTLLVREAASSAASREDDWKVRGGFESWLIAQGMRLMDRNTLLRQAGRKSGGRPNVQALETAAIDGGADYILEVQSTGSAAGAASALFRVDIKTAKTGVTLVSFSSHGDVPRAERVRYESDDNGYHRVVDQRVTTVDDIGQRLAVELGERLAPVLKPRVRSKPAAKKAAKICD